MPDESFDDLIHRLSDDGAGNLASSSEIHDNIYTEFETLGTVVADVGSLPADAGLRASGVFYDPADAEQWLADGGLVFFDSGGNNEPHTVVYFVAELDDYDAAYYQVYIREDSD